MGYLFDSGVKLAFVGIDDSLEIGLVLIIFGIEIEDDFGELGDLLAHFVVQLDWVLVHVQFRYNLY